MNSGQGLVHAVPTNIITGFLGVGKTSTILHLLENKPGNERWAVLVNEFGEIGIDGSLFEGQRGDKQGVVIREVPGGCMCCAAGLPMQVALNQLLVKARPDRLLIEPTGLGHPKEVLNVLLSIHYRESLSLQKTLTLLDARKLSDSRYTSHETFNQQIAVADTVIGNKLDLYEDKDQEKLIAYVKKTGKAQVKVIFSQHGEVALSELEGVPEEVLLDSSGHHTHEHQSRALAADFEIPECGYLTAVNEGEGFYSIGWRFSPDKVFDHQKLYLFLSGLQLERMKAVFITDKGFFGYNLTLDALTETKLDDCLESRVEMISDKVIDVLEPQLLACLVD